MTPVYCDKTIEARITRFFTEKPDKFDDKIRREFPSLGVQCGSRLGGIQVLSRRNISEMGQHKAYIATNH